MPQHKEILDKILNSITDHIDQIVKVQAENNGELDQKSAYVLVEYGKYLRTSKETDDTDYGNLTAEQLDAEILKIVEKEKSKK